jgi:hypothetical protein
MFRNPLFVFCSVFSVKLCSFDGGCFNHLYLHFGGCWVRFSVGISAIVIEKLRVLACVLNQDRTIDTVKNCERTVPQSVDFKFIVYFTATGLVPISYRGELLSILLLVSPIATSHNRPSTYQLRRRTTEHSSTCKSHSHKPQQAQCLSVTEERYWALFYI